MGAKKMIARSEQIFKQLFGNRFEREGEKTGEIKSKGIIKGGIELAVFKAINENKYDIHVHPLQERFGEGYIIGNVTEDEMKDLYNNLRKIYEK
jgi:hypothetical protein